MSESSSERSRLGAPPAARASGRRGSGSVLAILPEACRLHEPHRSSPEQPARLDAARAALQTPGLAAHVVSAAARPATDAELELVHKRWYVHTIRLLCEQGGGPLDADTDVSPGSFEAARYAAGAGLVAAEELRRRPELGGAFVAVRPPGHHALADRAMGLCVFNNVAILAASLLEAGERVAILDWDAHHGNGTQAAFWSEPRVLYVSMHQVGLYPDSGAVTERGGAGAELTTLNLPFPPGATGADYSHAFQELVEPVVRRFAPDWVLVSAGFDGHRDEPWADLELTASDYGNLAERARDLAPSPSRAVFVLEGGYSPAVLEASIRSVLLALTGAQNRTA